ncbi:hypothetical protein ANN_03007 [Periplaneta americana]|uniref:Uncharacterized protein n=1 Tax=Periplaneta americana TaxID=6978 RepID=A0ABQ8TXU8_PERAM|nr:hypothetical protein ANN_03007 [Periplaneta americana]
MKLSIGKRESLYTIKEININDDAILIMVKELKCFETCETYNGKCFRDVDSTHATFSSGNAIELLRNVRDLQQENNERKSEFQQDSAAAHTTDDYFNDLMEAFTYRIISKAFITQNNEQTLSENATKINKGEADIQISIERAPCYAGNFSLVTVMRISITRSPLRAYRCKELHSRSEASIKLLKATKEEDSGKNLNQITCPDRDSNRLACLTATPQVWTFHNITTHLHYTTKSQVDVCSTAKPKQQEQPVEEQQVTRYRNHRVPRDYRLTGKAWP